MLAAKSFPAASLPGPGDFVNDSIGASGCPTAAAVCFLRFNRHIQAIKPPIKTHPKATPIPNPTFAPDDKPPELLLSAADVVVVLGAVVDVIDVADVVGVADVVVVTLFQTWILGDQDKKPERAFPFCPRGTDELKTPNWKV